jgi:hypothetical protein
MNANLLEHLAQALSQKFNINLNDVKDVINDAINTFDQPKAAGGSSQGAPQTRTASPKKRGPTKDDLLKEAKALGLKVTTKMRKGEIQALLDAEKIPVATYHPSQVVATPEEPKPKRTPKATPEGTRQRQVPVQRTPSPKPKRTSPNVTPEGTRQRQVPVQRTPSPKPKRTPKASPKKGSLEGLTFKSIKNTWTFGKLLGTGGFGAVYEVEGNPNLVIKTGSDEKIKKGKDSGVFLEKAIYFKLKDPAGDKHGIPQVVDSGRLPKEVREARDYFIVLPRFETSLVDLNVTPQEGKKVINDTLEALKHLSKKGYIHLDIKPENIMRRKNGRWYLIDYGIAERFDQKTETTVDPLKAGNGTPWFMARDAHRGLMSRKADLESLVYTMVDMEGHKLPWHRQKNDGEKNKDYLQYILDSKQEFFDNYKNLNLPQYYKTLIEYVDKLQPGDDPKYDTLMIRR